MSLDNDEVRDHLFELIDFLIENGEIARSGQNRFRDFIIAREAGSFDDPPEDQYSFGEVDLPSESLDMLHGLVRDKVRAAAAALNDDRKSVVKYGEGHADREYIQYLTADDFEKLAAIESLLGEKRLDSTSYHEGLDPEFQAVRIMDHEDKMVVGLQHYWGNQLLGNTSLFNLYYKDEGHEPMDEPIISIPKRLYAVYYDGRLYILNEWRFEQMFDYHRIYQEVAEDVMESVQENEIKFADSVMVESAITNNPNMMRKMKRVQDTGLYSELDMDDIEWVIDEYSREGIKVVKTNGSRKIEIEDKLKVWELISILNDDHVESRLTKKAYQSSRKEEI